MDELIKEFSYAAHVLAEPVLLSITILLAMLITKAVIEINTEQSYNGLLVNILRGRGGGAALILTWGGLVGGWAGWATYKAYGTEAALVMAFVPLGLFVGLSLLAFLGYRLWEKLVTGTAPTD